MEGAVAIKGEVQGGRERCREGGREEGKAL